MITDNNCINRKNSEHVETHVFLFKFDDMMFYVASVNITLCVN